MSEPPPPSPGGDEGAQGPPPPSPEYPPCDTKTVDPPQGAYGPPPPMGPYPESDGLRDQPAYDQSVDGPPANGQPVSAPTDTGKATTVAVTQPAVFVVQTYQESPVHTCCPYCHADIVTATRYETGSFTWIICLCLCVVGCAFGCCLIPFFVNTGKDVIHSCPNCGQQVARWNRV